MSTATLEMIDSIDTGNEAQAHAFVCRVIEGELTDPDEIRDGLRELNRTTAWLKGCVSRGSERLQAVQTLARCAAIGTEEATLQEASRVALARVDTIRTEAARQIDEAMRPVKELNAKIIALREERNGIQAGARAVLGKSFKLVEPQIRPLAIEMQNLQTLTATCRETIRGKLVDPMALIVGSTRPRRDEPFLKALIAQTRERIDRGGGSAKAEAEIRLAEMELRGIARAHETIAANESRIAELQQQRDAIGNHAADWKTFPV